MELLTAVGRLTPKNTGLGIVLFDMVSRPSITLTNKTIPEDARRYAAAREFCTGFFGLASTYTFASFVEKYVPNVVSKAFFKTDLTKDLATYINNTGWSKLTPLEKNLKGLLVGSSFAGTLIALGIITPLLCNVFLNKLLDKVIKTKHIPMPTLIPASSLKTTNTTTLPGQVQYSPAFDRFLREHVQPKINTGK